MQWWRSLARREQYLLMVTAGALVAFVAWFIYQGYQSRHLELLQAQQQFDRLSRQVAQVKAFAQGRVSDDAAAGLDKDGVALVQQALRSAGLPLSAFKRVEARQEQLQGDLRLQQLQVQLQGLTPAEIGLWLQQWEQLTHPWELQACQLHAQDRRRRQNDGGQPSNQYDAQFTMTAPYGAVASGG